MCTNKRGKRGTIKGGGLPLDGRNQRNLAAVTRRSGEKLKGKWRCPGSGDERGSEEENQ
jgi:hypothetical protein